MITERSQPVSACPPVKHSDRHSRLSADLSTVLAKVRADTFRLYTRTKSFHWHMSGADFRAYHALLEDQAEQLLALTHAITDHMRGLQSGPAPSPDDGNVDFVAPEDALSELRLDNQILTGVLRSAQTLCRWCGDIVTASLVDVWIDEARRRAWNLFEAMRGD